MESYSCQGPGPNPGCSSFLLGSGLYGASLWKGQERDSSSRRPPPHHPSTGAIDFITYPDTYVLGLLAGKANRSLCSLAQSNGTPPHPGHTGSCQINSYPH